jgi:hypothetical protein
MSDIEDTLLRLRQEHLSCLKLARETDSKKEDLYLKSEASKALERLRKICSHNNYTVCLQSEDGGSYSMDYDDSSPEYRICLCCGIDERAYDGKFSKLTTKPFSRFERDAPIQIRNPLSFLLTEIIDIAETKGYH